MKSRFKPRPAHYRCYTSGRLEFADSRVQNLEEAWEVIARLQADLVTSGSRHAQELLQRLYGPKSEKLPPLDPVQLELLSDLVAPPVDPAMEEILTEDPAELERTPRRRAARHPLPENLETEVVRLEPEEKTCPHCGEAKCVLGEDVREELDYIPAKRKRPASAIEEAGRLPKDQRPRSSQPKACRREPEPFQVCRAILDH
ncbi:MAG TPA: IS66 family transposase zinc-finger binding domain-containing protein [Candidatus Limnocylindria bacterium]|nr:IS66 family transposase zinc-finger binding domain-containing protein [Candidatus Limnocylindria bacterium]